MSSTYLQLLIVFFLASSLPAQNQIKPAGAPPAALNQAVIAALNPAGQQVVSASGATLCEIWLRGSIAPGPDAKEDGVTLPAIPHGSLLGVIRFPTAASDRRGLPIKPGVYTLRFSYYPADGNHQGAAPQRDFLILSAAADDLDPNAKPNFNALMDLSRKASGTAHPLCLSFWKGDAVAKPELEQAGNDWILKTKIGETPVSIILIGKAEG